MQILNNTKQNLHSLRDAIQIGHLCRIPAQQEHPQSWGAFNDFPSGLTADTQCVDVAEVESEGRSDESIGEISSIKHLAVNPI